MTEADYIEFAQDQMKKWWKRFNITKPLYNFVIDDTNNWRDKPKKNYCYGWCTPIKRTIVIDYRHCEYNEEKYVKDTILHEIAHAIDYVINGYSSHGANWKRICRIIGAVPMAKGRKDSKKSMEERIKSAKYAIVDCRDPLKALGYCSRKLKNMHGRWYADNPSTIGRLYHVPSEIFLTKDKDLISSNMFQ